MGREESPLRNPEYTIPRQSCLELDIVPLAAGGWLAPGFRMGSMIGALKHRLKVPFVAETTDCEGLITVYWPLEQAIRLERVRGGAAGVLWAFLCPGIDLRCGSHRRKLLMPLEATAAGIRLPWACASCHRVIYHRSKRAGSDRR
jgi:hypothetical protein